MTKLSELVVIIRGGGEVASGIAYRLHILSNMRICLIEVAVPRAIARGVTFCEAVFDGTKIIMGVTAELVPAEEKEIQRTILYVYVNGDWKVGDSGVLTK